MTVSEGGARPAAIEPAPVEGWSPAVTILILFGVAVLYLLALAVIISRIEPCGDLQVSEWSILRPIDRYIQCRDINELGDALAGAFAPLAFLLLAGAVLIQSRELAAQRRELQLARDEARQTREVLGRQTEVSEATKEYIGEQTEMLRGDQARREQEEANRAFDQALNTFRDWYSEAALRFARKDPTTGREHIVSLRLTPDPGKTAEAFIAALIKGAQKQRKSLHSDYEHAPDLIRWENKEIFSGMNEELNRITGLIGKMTLAHRYKARGLSLGSLKRELILLFGAAGSLPWSES